MLEMGGRNNKQENVMWDNSGSFIIKMKILVHDYKIPVALGSLSA